MGAGNVKKPGDDRSSGHHPTQSNAINRARDIVHTGGSGEVVIHRPDGTIGKSDTVAPGNDSFPPRDTK